MSVESPMTTETLLEQSLRKTWDEAHENHGPKPDHWLVSKLAMLLEETHDRPAVELRSQVLRLVLEEEFADEHVGHLQFTEVRRRADRLADLTICALERTRLEAKKQGHWSDAPLTPQMFG